MDYPFTGNVFQLAEIIYLHTLDHRRLCQNPLLQTALTISAFPVVSQKFCSVKTPYGNSASYILPEVIS